MLLDRRKKGKTRWIALAFLGCLGILMILFLARKTDHPTANPSAVQHGKETGTANPAGNNMPSGTRMAKGEIVSQAPIDYNAITQEGEPKERMAQRKKTLGIQKSLDMIVGSDESFKVGNKTVSMKNILEQAFTQKGKVFEQEILDSGAALPTRIKPYGVYVVQPGDNLWNIHFRLLKDYYAAKGIKVASLADEPSAKGFSSGVGKILKFSETMVIVYNLVEGKVVKDINLLEPLSKVVVYNMEAIFNLLKEIDTDSVNRLEFDGKTIWIPAEHA